MPRRWHRCKTYTTYISTTTGAVIHVCACGALRLSTARSWTGKNARRKQLKDHPATRAEMEGNGGKG